MLKRLFVDAITDCNLLKINWLWGKSRSALKSGWPPRRDGDFDRVGREWNFNGVRPIRPRFVFVVFCSIGMKW